MSSTARDLATITDVIEPAGDPVPPTVVARARRTVASYAKDADDCRMLLSALGLGPDTDDAAGGGSAGHH
ncbi:hypothetical protein GCM10009665_08450 [Kitasatospora nipponensis]|uniref:Uncharacterized protein n=1 Tax=Kitasatospora nipponensis TaxID=258049 RepID=A0ABN1VTI5_9ACTN